MGTPKRSADFEFGGRGNVLQAVRGYQTKTRPYSVGITVFPCDAAVPSETTNDYLFFEFISNVNRGNYLIGPLLCMINSVVNLTRSLSLLCLSLNSEEARVNVGRTLGMNL